MVKKRVLQGCYTALALLMTWWIVINARFYFAARREHQRLVNRMVDLAKDVIPS